MVNLYILSGLPAASKTTWCNERLNGKYLFDDETTLPNPKLMKFIHRDEIRLRVGGSDLSKENLFAKEPIVISELYKEMRMACYKYLHVYIDSTALTVSSRRRLLNQVQDLIKVGKVEPYAIFFNTSVETCIERDKTRDGIFKVGEQTIRAMAARTILPTVAEGFKKIYFV